VVLHRLLFFVVPIGGGGENPFRLAIYLGHWWPGEPLREGVRIVAGRLWLSGRNERPAAAPTCEVIQVGRTEISTPTTP